MSHTWTSHVPRLNESCPTYKWAGICERKLPTLNHVTHMDESCPTYERVMSRFEWVMSHIQMSRYLWEKTTHLDVPMASQVTILKIQIHIIYTHIGYTHHTPTSTELNWFHFEYSLLLLKRGGRLGSRPKKNVRGEIVGWGRVPFNEPYAPSLSTIYDGA